MHLTVGRIQNDVSWTGEWNKCILAEFRAVWGEFLGELTYDLKPRFEHELQERRREFVGYPM
jgi:hypothetical protein